MSITDVPGLVELPLQTHGYGAPISTTSPSALLGAPMNPFLPLSTPVPHVPRPNEFSEAQFSRGIFDKVFNVAQTSPGNKQRRSRAKFQWPATATQEDRLLVAFRCMQQPGFDTVGEYFAAVLADGNNKHKPVYQSVAAFLQCRGVDVRTHPVSIVERIFQDPRSKIRHLLPTLPEPAKNHTQNALINWALQGIIARWKKEAELLLNPIFGFVCERRRDEVAERFSWFDVLNWSMTKNQEIIAVNAPAMFACMTSVAVNNRAQKKLNRAAKATSNLPPAEPDSDDTDDEDQDVTLSIGVPPKTRRDPWLGTTITILMLLFFRY
ncbi:hypothetical protein B0H10DRAFT_2438101 [Mycena sp. CBHHK59/15]|nr:hypothetical protein B0H10DRAFT_2438101 [Mycena sp. CBHHK59/15]